MRRTSPPSSVAGSAMRTQRRNGASASAIASTSGRRGGPGAREDCDLVEHQRHILHEDRVRQLGEFGEANHAHAERLQRLLVRLMLGAGNGEVDRGTRDVGELALGDGARDFAGEGGQHERGDGRRKTETETNASLGGGGGRGDLTGAGG